MYAIFIYFSIGVSPDGDTVSRISYFVLECFDRSVIL